MTGLLAELLARGRAARVHSRAGAPSRSPGERLCAECVRGAAVAARRLPALRAAVAPGRVCPAADAQFRRSWAPLAYEGVARKLVGALKFHGALQAGDLMAAQMAANLPLSLRDPALVPVPVPALAARRRARGFDPAHVLAGALARRGERPLADCLVRSDRTARQVGAGRMPAARPAASPCACAARRRRWRCSSTTSTPPARRSTRAPAPSSRRARPSSPRISYARTL